MTGPAPTCRYFLVEHPDRYSWDYWRPGTPRPSGFTLWRETEAEIVALCEEFNARLTPTPEPDTDTLPLFGGDL